MPPTLIASPVFSSHQRSAEVLRASESSPYAKYAGEFLRASRGPSLASSPQDIKLPDVFKSEVSFSRDPAAQAISKAALGPAEKLGNIVKVRRNIESLKSRLLKQISETSGPHTYMPVGSQHVEDNDAYQNRRSQKLLNLDPPIDCYRRQSLEVRVNSTLGAPSVPPVRVTQ